MFLHGGDLLMTSSEVAALISAIVSLSGALTAYLHSRTTRKLVNKIPDVLNDALVNNHSPGSENRADG